MEHWKRMIVQANHCFERGELVEARELYLQALALAQVLFERWNDVDQAVAACVVTHHNLADLHLSLEQPEESVEYLCAIHQRLLDVVHNTRFRAELRDAALRHSNRTLSELLSFIREHGEYPRTHRLLNSPEELSRRALSSTQNPATGFSHGVH